MATKTKTDESTKEIRIRKALAAHLVPEGKLLLLAMLIQGRTQASLTEMSETLNMAVGEVDYARSALAGAHIARKDGSADLIILVEGVFA